RNSFFFFQAEDGIRDFHVTGVQTCALPICHGPTARSAPLIQPEEAAEAEEGGISLHWMVAAVLLVVIVWFNTGVFGVRPVLVQEIGRASCRERGWMWRAAQGEIRESAESDG